MKSIITRPLFVILFLSTFLFSQTAQSQILISLLLGDKLNSDNIEFGIEGGFNQSWLSDIDEAKGLTNFHLGFYFDFRIKNNWFLNTGVRVKSNVGGSNINPYLIGDVDLDAIMANGHLTRKISYFYVPVHIKYRFSKQFFANAGFQLGLRNVARDLFYNTIINEDDIEFTYDIRDEITRIDAGLSAGLGYKFRGTGMNLGITYYYGLVDIMKAADITSKNSTFYIYVSIPVGAGDKDDK